MSYSFPLLQPKEVIQCLQELGLEFTEAQLLKPEFEPVAKLFENIVLLVMGVTREEMHQPAFSGMDSLEFPELHEDSVGVLAFSRNLYKMMRASGVHDFSLKDMYTPEHKRVVKLLSAVINLYKFREDKGLQWEEFEEESAAVLELVQTRTAANAAKAAELKRLTGARNAQLPHINELTAEGNALDEEIQELNALIMNLQAAVRDQKAEGHDVAEKASTAVAAAAAEKAETSRLRAQIVESPEELMVSLEEAQAAETRERAAVAEVERRLQELRARDDALAKTASTIRKTVGAIAEAQAEVDKYKVVKREVKELQAQAAKNEENKWALTSQVESLKRTTGTMSERLQRLQQQGTLKKEAAMATLKSLQEEKTSVEKRNAAAAARVNENDATAKRLQTQIADLKRSHAREEATINAKFEGLREAMQEYHMQLAAAIDMPLSARDLNVQ